MSAHTAGPWFVTPADEGHADGGFVQWGEYRISAGSIEVAAPGYYRIGSVSNVNNSDANKANARLIAAAPRMLAALEMLHERLMKCSRDPISAAEAYDSFYQNDVLSAIAAAKGES